MHCRNNGEMLMSKSNSVARENYSVDKLGLTELGPSAMGTALAQHIRYSPNKPIMMIGEPGIGKTAVTNQLELVLKETESCTLLTIRLVNEDEGTMNGYADPDKDTPTVTLRVVRKVYEAGEKARKSGKRLIIFFDELNRAKEHMIKFVFNIIDTKRWGDYELPEKTSFVSAINPPTRNHKVKDVLADSALRRRFAVYGVCAVVEEYLEYARRVKIHPAVIGFLKAKPNLMYDYVSLDNGKPFACPASWDTVSDVLYGYEREGGKLSKVGKNVTINRILVGQIGEATTSEVLQFAEDLTQRFAPENIYNKYDDIRDEVKDAVNSEFTEENAEVDLSKIAVITSNLSVFLANQIVSKDIRFHITEDEIGNEDTQFTEKAAKKINKCGRNIAKYLSDMPSDMFQSFISTTAQNIKENLGTNKMKHAQDKIAKLNEIIAYPEYSDACDRFLEANQAMN